MDRSRPDEEAEGDFHSPRATLFRLERPTQPLRRPTTAQETSHSPRPTASRQERPTVGDSPVKERPAGQEGRSQGKQVNKEDQKEAATRSGQQRGGSITSRLLNMVGRKLDKDISTSNSQPDVDDTLDSNLGKMVLARKESLPSVQEDSGTPLRKPRVLSTLKYDI